MLKTVVYIISAVCFCFFSCKKTGDAKLADKVEVTKLSSDSVYVGDELEITGSNFGTDTSKVAVTLNTTKIPVKSLSDNKIIALIPNDLISSGSESFTLVVQADGFKSDPVKIKILFKGWYYASFSFPTITASLEFLDENNGLADVQSTQFISNLYYSIENDGQDLYPGYMDGGPYTTARPNWISKNSGWAEINWFDISYIHNNDWHNARIDTIKSIPGFQNKPITGLYLLNENNEGYIAREDGQVYKINGAFTPNKIVKEYQGIFEANNPGNGGQYRMMSGVDADNFLISGYYYKTAGALPTPVIIHKNKGVYHEYAINDFDGYFLSIQLTSDSVGYFLNSNYELYKLNDKEKWVKMPQQLNTVYFMNSSVGYGCWKTKVLKTIDGGKSWTTEFNLMETFGATAIYCRDNHVWVCGTPGNGFHDGFLLHYKPKQ